MPTPPDPTEYRLDVLPYNREDIETRRFTSRSVTDLVCAVHWMIEKMPSKAAQSEARVQLMLSLRHAPEVQMATRRR